MSLKYLHDLPGLEVPEVYLHVFAPAHDVLPAWSEVCEYAVRPVRVSGVGLYTLGRLCRPKPDSRVLSASQNEPRIRCEFDVRTAGLVSDCIDAPEVNAKSYQIGLSSSARVFKH